MDQLFFHGSIRRPDAEALLVRSKKNGKYLIRKSTSDEGNYVLSLAFNNQAMHFKIKHEGECWFSIDDGPVFEGLDDLIEHFCHFADGLPCPLTTPVPVHGDLNYQEGNTKLHTACALGDRKLASKNMKAADASAVNAFGRTPLHEACRNGHEKVINDLLSKRAKLKFDVNATDHEGWTPLHFLACRGPAAVVLKMVEQGASATIANKDGETPRQIASRVGNSNTCRVLADLEDKIDLGAIKTLLDIEYYHGKLNRVAAENIVNIYGSGDGLFLLRYSVGSGNYILSMCFNQSCFHFQIQRSSTEACYYIDDGPGFSTLTDLIQHYRLHSDGLPCSLTRFCKRSARHGGGATPIEEDIYVTGDLKKSKPKSKPVRPSTYEPPIPQKKRSPSSSSASGMQTQQQQHYQQPASSSSLNTSSARTSSSGPPPPRPRKSRPSVPSTDKEDYDKMAELDELMKRQQLVGVQPSALNTIQYSDIKLGSELGSGEFGKVYQGVYQTKSGPVNVALKTLQQDKMNGSDDFLREAKLMAALRHKNVVLLLGVVQKPMLMIVQELVKNGALIDYLQKQGQGVSDRQRIVWASEIANGMNYLEKQKYVHRDLAARNILLGETLNAKISDFGLSRTYEDNYYQASQGGRWPVRWYAPECINYGKFTSKSDVWSFGVTLWEIWTSGDLPYGSMNGSEIVEYLQRGKRLKSPKECPNAVVQIMKTCWFENHEDRPTFTALLRKFTRLLRLAS